MNMDDQDDCVLLIESDVHAATFIRAALADARDGPFAVEWVANLQAGLERLSKGGIKAILLNLFLSDRGTGGRDIRMRTGLRCKA